MNRSAYFASMSPFGKLLLLLGLVLVFAVFTAISGLLIGKFYLGVSIMEIATRLSNPNTRETILFIKFYQLYNQVGIFILPVVFYAFFVSPAPGKELKLDRAPTAVSLLISFLVVYSILPFLNYIAEWNQLMEFPEAFSGIEQWMKDKEKQAMELTEIFLQTQSIGGLLANLFIVALVPAIGEELLFRGVLLRLLKDMMRNVHLAVFVSAIIFSAFHLQFYGFLPRLLLGLMLGYVFVYSGNLWAPMFLHFVNNASSVIVYYLHHNGHIKTSMDSFGASPNLVLVIGSLLGTVWLMIILYQKEGQFRR